MKKFLLFVLALSIAFVGADAQTSKEAIKEHKATARYTEKELEKKSSKTVRKQAKTLKKEGWIVSPGQLPLEKQLERAYGMELAFNDDGEPKYLHNEGRSVGTTYDAAHMQAVELAKLGLAGLISSEIVGLVENKIANSQLSASEAASIVDFVAASKNIVAQRLGRILLVVECYREIPKSNSKEVLVRAFYNADTARKMGIQVIREELEKKGEALQDKLDELLQF